MYGKKLSRIGYLLPWESHRVLPLDLFYLSYFLMICQVCYSTQVYWLYLWMMLSAF